MAIFEIAFFGYENILLPICEHFHDFKFMFWEWTNDLFAKIFKNC